MYMRKKIPIEKPVFVKSDTRKSGFDLSVTAALLAFGNELTGRHMAALIIRVEPMTKSFE